MNQNLVRNTCGRFCIKYFLPSFSSFDQTVSEEKIFKKLTNQIQELPVSAMFVNGLGENG
jgi:hypothetical protein